MVVYHHKNGLTLEKLGESHLGELREMKGESWSTQHQTVFLNSFDQDNFFRKVSSSSRDFYMVATQEKIDHLVGLVCVTDIDWISSAAQVGMMAHPKTRGCLEAKLLPEVVTDFAFEMLNLRRLEAEVLDNNPAALMFDLKLGYQVEGRKRKAVYKCGHYHDSICIGMLREEWEASERVRRLDGVCNLQYKKRGPIDRVIDRASRPNNPIELCKKMGEFDPKYDPNGDK